VCYVCLRPTILYPLIVAWNRLALSLIMHHPPCAAHHLLNINFHWLLIMHCSLFVAYHALLIICCLSYITHCLLHITHCSLFVAAYHALLIICCLSCIAHRLLCSVYCLLYIMYCLSCSTHYSAKHLLGNINQTFKNALQQQNLGEIGCSRTA